MAPRDLGQYASGPTVCNTPILETTTLRWGHRLRNTILCQCLPQRGSQNVPFLRSETTLCIFYSARTCIALAEYCRKISERTSTSLGKGISILSSPRRACFPKIFCTPSRPSSPPPRPGRRCTGASLALYPLHSCPCSTCRLCVSTAPGPSPQREGRRRRRMAPGSRHACSGPAPSPQTACSRSYFVQK